MPPSSLDCRGERVRRKQHRTTSWPRLAHQGHSPLYPFPSGMGKPDGGPGKGTLARSPCPRRGSLVVDVCVPSMLHTAESIGWSHSVPRSVAPRKLRGSTSNRSNAPGTKASRVYGGHRIPRSGGRAVSAAGRGLLGLPQGATNGCSLGSRNWHPVGTSVVTMPAA
jgi:hypothetical protein